MISSTEPTTTRLRRWPAFLVAFALLFGLGAVWSFATPHMAVPDEPAHVIRAAAVVRGDLVPRQSAVDPYMSDVDVPEWAARAHSLTCFAFDPTIPASCQPEVEDDDELMVARTSAGINSPVYYAIVGLPSLVLDGAAAFYAMRLVNAALTAALLAVAFMSLVQLPRARWTVVALAVAVTPMALFLSGGVNPNSIEFASAAALFATLIAMARIPSPGKLLWERAALVVVSAALLVNTRNISLLWLAIILLFALLLSERDVVAALVRRPATWVMAGVSAVAAALAFFWFIRPQPAIPDEEVPIYPLIGGNFVLGAQVMLDRDLEFATGWIGLFGWIDTPSPALSILIWSTLVVGLIGAALLFAHGRWRWAAAALVALALGLPIVIQSILLPDYGIIWQGRYMIAIYLCMMIVVGLALDHVPPILPEAARSRVIRVMVVAVAVGHVVSFLWVLRRYVVGNGTWTQMLLSPAWQPPLTWLGLTAAFLALIAAAAITVTRFATGGRIASEHPQETTAVAA